jgi:hypothetical protein
MNLSVHYSACACASTDARDQRGWIQRQHRGREARKDVIEDILHNEERWEIHVQSRVDLHKEVHMCLIRL